MKLHTIKEITQDQTSQSVEILYVGGQLEDAIEHTAHTYFKNAPYVYMGIDTVELLGVDKNDKLLSVRICAESGLIN